MTETSDLKLVSDYCGIDFAGCMELDCYTYQLLLKDAFVERMKQTEEGKSYLEDCYLIQQVKPDRKALKERFGGDKA